MIFMDFDFKTHRFLNKTVLCRKVQNNIVSSIVPSHGSLVMNSFADVTDVLTCSLSLIEFLEFMKGVE